MTETQKFALLRDLAYLVKRYGPTVFSELASYLKNPNALAELVTILEAGELAGRKPRLGQSRALTKPKQDTRASVQHMLSNIENKEPEKARILSALYEELAAKRALPTLRHLSSFASDNGLKAVNATSRDKAIGTFMRDLAARPLEQVYKALARIKPIDTTGDRTLEGWTDIILSKEHARRGGTP